MRVTNMACALARTLDAALGMRLRWVPAAERSAAADTQWVMFPIGCVMTIGGVGALALKYKQSGASEALNDASKSNMTDDTAAAADAAATGNTVLGYDSPNGKELPQLKASNLAGAADASDVKLDLSGVQP